MGLLDIFSFKKDFSAVATTANFDALKTFIRDKIVEQVKEKALSGIEKMDNVVEEVTEFIEDRIYSDNSIVQWLIDNILMPDVRVITQAVYDLLKETVKNL